MHRLVCVLLVIGTSLSSEDLKPRPKFSDFPVKEIYRGAPALPKLVTQSQRTFRTMIRRGAKNRVEFAGHYTVPMWGCGTECAELAIVDSITGKVYDVPFSVVELPVSWLENHNDEDADRMKFHANSRLMKFNACPNERDCGFYDYIMVEGTGLKLVRKELLPKKYQSE